MKRRGILVECSSTIRIPKTLKKWNTEKKNLLWWDSNHRLSSWASGTVLRCVWPWVGRYSKASWCWGRCSSAPRICRSRYPGWMRSRSWLFPYLSLSLSLRVCGNWKERKSISRVFLVVVVKRVSTAESLQAREDSGSYTTVRVGFEIDEWFLK